MTDEQITRYNKPVEHKKTYVCRCNECGKIICKYYRRSKFIQAIDKDGAKGWYHGKTKCGRIDGFSYTVE